MKKNFYVQTDSQNRITDVIEMPHEDYKKVEFDTPLPPLILGGCYEFVGGSAIYRKEWDENVLEDRIVELENAIATLAYGGEM